MIEKTPMLITPPGCFSAQALAPWGLLQGRPLRPLNQQHWLQPATPAGCDPGMPAVLEKQVAHDDNNCICKLAVHRLEQTYLLQRLLNRRLLPTAAQPCLDGFGRDGAGW